MPSDGTTRSALHLFAPAKVNLILRVLDRRPDGFHEIWSVMQTVGLADRLTLRLGPESAGITLASDEPSLPADRRNLVYRAAELVLAEAKLAVGLAIRLQKQIPIAAGLGGGSSDAAATILGLNRLLGLGWPLERMARLGAELGSDVPFFFFAPSAVAQGRGERLSSLSVTGRRWIVLVHPGFPISTRWAYEQVAESRKAVTPLADAHAKLSRAASVSWEELVPLMANDFEAAVFPSHPILAEIKTLLRRHGAEGALLSGSGATVFGVFKDQAAAERAAAAAGRTKGCRAYAVNACRHPAVQRPDGPQWRAPPR